MTRATSSGPASAITCVLSSGYSAAASARRTQSRPSLAMSPSPRTSTSKALMSLSTPLRISSESIRSYGLRNARASASITHSSVISCPKSLHRNSTTSRQDLKSKKTRAFARVSIERMITQ